MTNKGTAFYVHFPYCASRCNYCGFYSTTRLSETDAFTAQAVEEITALAKSHPQHIIKTIYFGGGTPSLMPFKNLERIANAIFDNFNTDIEEFTVEVNPDSAEDLPRYKDFGADRISLGVQSLDDGILTAAGRRHTAKQALSALQLAASHYRNVSADIILGFSADRDPALEVKDMMQYIKHLSAYMLKVERGTLLNRQIVSKKVTVATDDDVADEYEKLYNYCDSMGLKRYETSNFANDGFESKHNSRYWDMSEYFGIGPSAHSFIDNVRYYNKESLDVYLSGGHSGNNRQIITRKASRAQECKEAVMLALRTERGLDVGRYNAAYGKDFLKNFAEQIQKTAAYTALSGGYFSIKPQYMLLQNSIITEFI